ncbi:MAG: hypothetical protein QOD96_5353, partial [Pseudonocardiales bacterium]|nr:hypothetical protein [Pseudonocardiales bacterium]
GPHRVVSLMSSEAVRDLGLEPGSLADAVIKTTNVVLETPNPPAGSTRPRAGQDNNHHNPTE